MDDSFPAVEQAVIAIRLGKKENAVSLAQATPNASEIDIDELLNWAKRVELFGNHFDETNLFFFPTPSGALAIGRLTPNRDRPESAKHYYFQTMLVARSVFYRCGSNPVTIYHLALNTTHFSLFTKKSRLKPFILNEGRSWIDVPETQRTSEQIGARAVATLTESILDSIQTSFASEQRAFLVVSTLFSFLPISWRPELTFSVGVKFRGDAPIRLLGATVKRGDVPYTQTSTPFFDLRDVSENNLRYPIVNSWAALVETAIKAGRVGFFYQKLAENFFDAQQDDEFEREITPDEIAAWGDDWRQELEAQLTKENLIDENDESLKNWKKNDESNDGVDFNADKPLCAWENWEDDENDKNWGLETDRWRIDSNETDAFSDANRLDETFERRGVDFIFDDEPLDENADLSPKKRNGDSLNDDLIRLLKKLRQSEIDESREEPFLDPDASATPEASKNADAETQNADKNKKNTVFEKRNQDEEKRPNSAVPPDFLTSQREKRRVIVTGSLKGSDFAETVRRLKQTLTPKKSEPTDAEPLNGALSRNEFSIDRIPTPFPVLRDEFPEDETALHRLNDLIINACGGNDGATQALADFWINFQIKRDEERAWRIRDEYFDYLNRLLRASLDTDVSERIDLTTNALDVFDIISR